MKYRNLLLATSALLTAAACSNDGTAPEEVGKSVELRLTSSLSDGQTRAFDTDADITRLQGEQIAAGEKVYAWVDSRNSTTTSAYVNAWELTAGTAAGEADGSFRGDTHYYPSSGDNVDIYCIHGNFTGITAGTTAFPETALTHTVALDQSTPANYQKSDLLYGSVQNQARKTSQSIIFKHKLAKVEVKLKVGTGTTVAQLTNEGTTVHILNTKNRVQWLPVKQDAFASVTPATTIPAYGGTLGDLSFEDATTAATTGINMYLQKDASVADAIGNIAVFGEAIVVPQTLTATAAAPLNFIKVHLNDGGDLYAKITSNITFEPGKKYIYNITVNLTGITLTSTITNWTNGTGNDLNANI